MSLSKNFKIIMTALSFLLISILTMLCIYISYNTDTPDLEFKIASNITLDIGDTITIVYEVSETDAEVTFIIADPTIASISGNSLTALKEGSTILRATAIYNGQIKYANSTIVVNHTSAPAPLKYTYKIEPAFNCSFKNNILYLDAEMVSFKLTIFDSENNIFDYESEDIIKSCSENIEVTKEIEYFIITADSDGLIEFEIKEIGLKFSILIKIS